MDYAALAAQVARGTGQVCELSSATLAILLSALGHVTKGSFAVKPTTTQWDVIENWLATAAYELLVAHECDEGEVGAVEIDCFRQIKQSGQSGDASTGTTCTRAFSGSDPNNAGNVVLTGYQYLTPVPGVYYVTAALAAHSLGRSASYLYNEETTEVILHGLPVVTNVPHVFSGLLEVVEDDYFTVKTEISESGYMGYPLSSATIPEKYADITFMKLPDAT